MFENYCPISYCRKRKKRTSALSKNPEDIEILENMLKARESPDQLNEQGSAQHVSEVVFSYKLVVEEIDKIMLYFNILYKLDCNDYITQVGLGRTV
jgi:hypothetical protein